LCGFLCLPKHFYIAINYPVKILDEIDYDKMRDMHPIGGASVGI